MGQGTTREVEAGKGTMTHDPNVKIIESASRDDVRPGDHLTWTKVAEDGDVTNTLHREGIAHHRDVEGDWRTAGGVWITDGMGKGTTLTIRRPVRELPTSPGIVIVPNDGREAIEAESGGRTWRASEAILGANNRWYGVWRKVSEWDSQADPLMLPEDITPDTWKVEEK